MIIRGTHIVLVHNLNQQSTLTNISNIAIKAYLQEVLLRTKRFLLALIFVLHCLNLATKAGVLQIFPLKRIST
jgi:hypothetical protein